MAGEIERKLNEAGYHMLSKDNKIERLILSILKTKNTRYLKSIPFLIYKYNPNIESLFEKTKENNLFANIIHITKEIFHELNIEIKIPEINYKNENLNYNEFREEFKLQLKNENKSGTLIDKLKIYAERNLEMWLSQIFTKKEKQIIKDIMNDRQLSKTDYEYYSRKTKKKLNSITNLQDFSRTIYAKKPECIK
ncbi:hypothetical protein J4446_03640 [Candidatus Woesearchaeota archaeon]|nr:hypothetical protein [Candidatus Woesearchaeota archaeon]